MQHVGARNKMAWANVVARVKLQIGFLVDHQGGLLNLDNLYKHSFKNMCVSDS
jgi:hypothetical protein